MRKIVLALADDVTDTRCGTYCPTMRCRDAGVCGRFGKLLGLGGNEYAARDHERAEWLRSDECLAAESEHIAMSRDAGSWRAFRAIHEAPTKEERERLVNNMVSASIAAAMRGEK